MTAFQCSNSTDIIDIYYLNQLFEQLFDENNPLPLNDIIDLIQQVEICYRELSITEVNKSLFKNFDKALARSGSRAHCYLNPPKLTII